MANVIVITRFCAADMFVHMYICGSEAIKVTAFRHTNKRYCMLAVHLSVTLLMRNDFYNIHRPILQCNQHKQLQQG